MSDRSFNKILSIYKKDIKLLNNKIVLKGTTKMIGDRNLPNEIDSNSYIDKLHKIIKYQEKEIESLNETPAQKPVEKELWNSVTENVLFETDIKLDFKRFDFGRTIKSIQGVKNLSKALGYSESFIISDIYNIGEYEQGSEHASYKKFIHKDSYNGLRSITKSFFKGLQLFKKMIVKDKDYFIETDITYIAKDGSYVYTKCFNWVDLDFHESHFSVKTKMVILDPEVN